MKPLSPLTIEGSVYGAQILTLGPDLSDTIIALGCDPRSTSVPFELFTFRSQHGRTKHAVCLFLRPHRGWN